MINLWDWFCTFQGQLLLLVTCTILLHVAPNWCMLPEAGSSEEEAGRGVYMLEVTGLYSSHDILSIIVILGDCFSLSWFHMKIDWIWLYVDVHPYIPQLLATQAYNLVVKMLLIEIIRSVTSQLGFNLKIDIRYEQIRRIRYLFVMNGSVIDSIRYKQIRIRYEQIRCSLYPL